MTWNQCILIHNYFQQIQTIRQTLQRMTTSNHHIVGQNFYHQMILQMMTQKIQHLHLMKIKFRFQSCRWWWRFLFHSCRCWPRRYNTCTSWKFRIQSCRWWWRFPFHCRRWWSRRYNICTSGKLRFQYCRYSTFITK